MWNWLSKGENLSGLGSLIQGAGGIYGAVSQANMAKKLLGLQREAFQNQLAMQKEDIARRDWQDEAFNTPFGGLASIKDLQKKQEQARGFSAYPQQGLLGVQEEQKLPNYYGV